VQLAPLLQPASGGNAAASKSAIAASAENGEPAEASPVFSEKGTLHPRDVVRKANETPTTQRMCASRFEYAIKPST
jgi:hypothetical protein